MNRNSNLCTAFKAKNDEFFTPMNALEAEIPYYKEQFKGKTVYCNCDNPEQSNFWKFFKEHFHEYGLKMLIATYYNPKEATYATKYDGITTAKTLLSGNGDFRSDECISFIQEADILVTNIPFSLFRAWIKAAGNKKYLIIANINAISYKEFFPLIKEGSVKLGYSKPKEFLRPDGTIQKFGNICWFTTLDKTISARKLMLTESYSSEKYIKYDNYDAIEVSRLKDIPADYNGVMGVPITILDVIDRKQFKIVGLTTGRNEFECRPIKKYINAFQHNKDGTVKNGSKLNSRAAITLMSIPKDGTYYTAENCSFPLKSVYPRVLIKRIC